MVYVQKKFWSEKDLTHKAIPKDCEAVPLLEWHRRMMLGCPVGKTSFLPSSVFVSVAFLGRKRTTEVTVWLKLSAVVPYTIRVRDPHSLKEIKSTLGNSDPCKWAYDPDLYEVLGEKFSEMVNSVKRADVDLGKADGQTPLDTRKGVFPNFDSM